MLYQIDVANSYLYNYKKMCKLVCAAVVGLLLLTSSHAQHDEAAKGETTNSETVETKETPPCAQPLEDLRHSIEEIFPENYTVYLNCISFDGEGALKTAIASGNWRERLIWDIWSSVEGMFLCLIRQLGRLTGRTWRLGVWSVTTPPLSPVSVVSEVRYKSSVQFFILCVVNSNWIHEYV